MDSELPIRPVMNFGKWLAMGITLLISGQALFNIAMVCGIMPVTGVPLPLLVMVVLLY